MAKRNFIIKFLRITLVLAFLVVVVGAYTRLTDAGLGCPDWPGCYGKLVAPLKDSSIVPKIEPVKAWTEMIHRYIAGILLLLVVYMAGFLTWHRKHKFNYKLSIFIAVFIFWQALLGMWTVTMRLYPVVVMAHLLSGFTLLSCLYLLLLQSKSSQSNRLLFQPKIYRGYRMWAWLGFVALIIQIFLGGWVSANYAALACPDFPTCQGQIIPNLDFANGFNLFSTGIMDSPGTALENPARVTIQVMHRFWAVITAILLLFLGHKAIKVGKVICGISLSSLVIIQFILGICNVIYQLPLSVATLHNAIAALLMLHLVNLLYHGYKYIK